MGNRLIYIFLYVTSLTLVLQSCDNEQSIEYKRYYVNGKGLYEKNCRNCHGAEGKGLGTLYPPLTDSTYLIKSKTKLACIIRYGQNKSISINNVTYDGQMPGNETLADIDIAQLIVYITNSFGNKQGFYEATEAGQALKACK